MDGKLMNFKYIFLIALLPFTLFAANTNVFDNVLINGRLLNTNKIDTNARTLIDSVAATSVDWQNRALMNGGIIAVDWSGNARIFDLSGAQSILWDTRSLRNSASVETLNWNSRTLTGAWLLNGAVIITNNASPTFGALTVTTINGKLPAQLVTNITSSTLTVTGQGTSTINVEGASGTGAAALTNAPNIFTTASPNTFNGITLFNGVVTNTSTTTFNGSVVVNAGQTNNMTAVFSNIISRGGIVFYRQEKTATYTNTINDYYIAWKGTTASQVTNFLPSGVLNGRTYVIKDAQRSAMTTNIIVKPVGSDTIGGATSFPININGQSITVTYDGVSNYEIN